MAKRKEFRLGDQIDLSFLTSSRTVPKELGHLGKLFNVFRNSVLYRDKMMPPDKVCN